MAHSLRGTLFYGGHQEACRVLDLSPRGACLERPAFPPVTGEKVELFLPGTGWLTLRVTGANHGELFLSFAWESDPRIADLLAERTHTLH